MVLHFFTKLFHEGIAYKTMNTARSALSSLGIIIDNFVVGKHPIVVRFLTGVFNMRPPKTRYTEIWDVGKVLHYLKQLPAVEDLSLKMLTYKLVMLVALTQACRSQSLGLLSLENCIKNTDSYVLQYNSTLKQSKPGKSVPSVVLKRYTLDQKLCVVHTLTEYINRTKTLRGNNNALFISYLKPHYAVTTSTISRWIRSVMFLAGIDIRKFKSHSVRSASTSKAKLCNIPVPEIMKVAGWSSQETFAMYYNKPIEQSGSSFADAVLS